ncbi:hypothetical protein NQ317_017907 [Molorchus minor]|uniref:Uncharacterized protein n=1 Tax=Molorchus minor TaxID=1323400 RepID=A0ABQ9J6D5_9CUCU|nr:hypothetical protein NQ317_017907 [Molorchus minor]
MKHLICVYILAVVLEYSTADFVADNLLIFPERQPAFEKPSYKANVIDGSIEIADGPIRLLNCDLYNFDITVGVDESKYYSIVNPPPPSVLIKNCSVLFFAYTRDSVKVDDVLYDIMTIEAFVDSFYSIARTHVVVINTSSYDPYKLVYNVNGTEYVILNYFYFKLFLLVIVTIGAAILVLEIREIVYQYKNKSYSHLEDDIVNI